MNDQEIYQVIFSNFNESLKNYDNKSKSDFWIKFFNKSKISKINQLNLKNFRKPKIWGSKLSSGMDDDFEFFPTMEAYIQLLDTVKKKDILDYIELKVGNPKYYNIGGVDLNHHEISMFYSFNKPNYFIITCLLFVLYRFFYIFFTVNSIRASINFVFTHFKDFKTIFFK